MNKQFGLWLLLLWLLSPQTATAQHFIRPSPKRSHYNLPGVLDLANAQEMMAQRLQELHELHQLQDQVQELIKDDQFHNYIQGLSESELRGLRKKLLNGQGLSQDRNWNNLLEQAQQAAARHHLDERQIDKILRRWAERAERRLSSPASGRMRSGGADQVAPTQPSTIPPSALLPPPPLPPPVEPEPSLFDRLQEKTTKWLMEELDDAGGDMLQTLTEMAGNEGNSSLAELLRSVPQSDFSGINIDEHPLVPTLRSGTLSRYLSNVGDFLHRQSGVWNGVSALFREAPRPSLSNIRSPAVSMRGVPTADGDGWLPALVSLLMLGVIVLLLYKRGLGSKSSLGSGEGAEWCLGPWPVLPGAVSTRQDVIRAFEHLALLCLGPAAAACHHRQLAERLAALPPHSLQNGGSEGEARRRQAAEMLAWLYEQARYAPAGDALSQEQLSDARHALCFFAGVTAL